MSAPIQIMIWWLLTTLLGVITLPLTIRVFSFLPDRGLGFARLLGLLLTSYLVWLLGFVHYSAVSGALVWIALAALSYWIYSGHAQEIKAVLKEKGGLLIIYEVLFLVLLCLWAAVRMSHHNIEGQEKFMDFAFFNSIPRADSFPPFDPWQAGKDNFINYYYFGYFAMSNFARFTGLAPDVAYNLVVAFVFALCGQAVFSMAYNLTRAMWPGYLGVLFLQGFGNLEMATVQSDKPIGIANWWNPTRLIRDVVNKNIQSPRTFVNDWWHSARPEVLEPLGMSVAANARDAAISEFPAFSFLHGDIHPHFIAIPFVLLALAFGLNLLKNPDKSPIPSSPGPWGLGSAAAAVLLAILVVLKPSALAVVPSATLVVAGIVMAALAWPRDLERGLSLAGLCLSLAVVAMTNTWDLPAYGLTLSLCLLVHQHHHHQLKNGGWVSGWLVSSALLLGGLLLLAGPFFANFVNPAQGLAVSLAKTGLRDTLIFWGLFLLVLIPYLALRVRVWALGELGKIKEEGSVSAKKISAKKTQARQCKKCGSKLRTGKTFCAQCGSKNEEKFYAAASASVSISGSIKLKSAGMPRFARQSLMLLGAPIQSWRAGADRGAAALLLAGVVLFLGLVFFYPTSALFFALVFTAALLLAGREDGPEALFATVLLLVGSALVLGVEWMLVKDTFYGGAEQGSLARMNTIFKFYFQAWILFSVAVPFLLWWLAGTLFRLSNPVWRFAYFIPLALVALGAAKYPLAGYSWVSHNNRNAGFLPTLDGADWFKRRYPADWRAIEKLRKDVSGHPVVAEAVGSQYTHFARVASYTGLPTPLGWGGHELQWRGKYPSGIENDMKIFYSSVKFQDPSAPIDAKRIIKKYDITYVFVGQLERRKFSHDGLIKFDGPLEIFYQDQGTVIYKVRGK